MTSRTINRSLLAVIPLNINHKGGEFFLSNHFADIGVTSTCYKLATHLSDLMILSLNLADL